MNLTRGRGLHGRVYIFSVFLTCHTDYSGNTAASERGADAREPDAGLHRWFLVGLIIDGSTGSKTGESVGGSPRKGLSAVDEWKPILVLPNLDMRGGVECEFAAIVSPADPRVEKIRSDHPNLTTFLSKFSDQFGDQRWPALLILRSDAPAMCYTAEAVTALRDLVSLSAIPLARSQRLRFDRGKPLAYSTAFQFYSWMLDKQHPSWKTISTFPLPKLC
jgi:hypothetical protein